MRPTNRALHAQERVGFYDVEHYNIPRPERQLSSVLEAARGACVHVLDDDEGERAVT